MQLQAAFLLASRRKFPALYANRTPSEITAPAWVARKETPALVHPQTNAVQPVSEGLDKTEWQVVRQTLHRRNRCLKGLLGRH